MTSPGAFFVFSKFWFRARYWGKKAENDSKWQKIILWYQSTLKYWLHPFLPRSSQKPVRPPTFMGNPPSKFWRTWLPLWNVPLSKKAKTHFWKKQKILFSKMKWEHIWMLKYEYTVAKSKNQRRVRFLLSILFLLGSLGDLVGIFNADSRKSISKFSGLRRFLLFEDLYNG